MFQTEYLLTLLFVSTLFFGCVAIYFSKRYSDAHGQLKAREKEQKQRLYELLILRELQDRIGYSLDVGRVIDVITGSLRNLFQYSTASSLLIADDKLIFKAYVEEAISKNYLDEVKKTMVSSLSLLADKPLPIQIEESTQGMILQNNQAAVKSFFNIPLVVNDHIVGLINVSSIQPGLYKEGEMTLLYQIINQASQALSKLQEVLNREKGKLLAMMKSLSDGIFMVDTTNQLLVINDRAKEFLHIEENSPTILSIFTSFVHINEHLNKKVDIAQSLSQVIKNGVSVEEKQLQMYEKTIQLFVNPVTDAQTGAIIGASVLLHDITLEKNLEKMKEDFTNIVIHELRAPLTAIRGSAKLLEADDLSQPEQKKLLVLIHNQSESLLNQVTSLLDAAKIDAGRFTVQKEPNDLAALIEERIDFFQPQAQGKEITIQANVDPALPKFDFDMVKVSQILNNLLSNSIKFTNSGGKITISARLQSSVLGSPLSDPGSPVVGLPVSTDKLITDQPDSENRKQKTDNWIILSVTDTGMGIPKDRQHELFSRFVQITNATSAMGSGLGLFVVKGIVEAHGGTVHLESTPGVGTTITCSFPFEQTPLPAHSSNGVSNNQVHIL